MLFNFLAVENKVMLFAEKQIQLEIILSELNQS